MNSTRLLLPAVILCLVTVSLRAQEEGAADAAQAKPSVPVQKLEWLAANAWAFSGKAKLLNEPEASGMLRMMGPGGPLGSRSTPFQGDLEIARAGTKETLVCSKKALPGFAIYAKGSSELARQTTKLGKTIDLELVGKDLNPLARIEKTLDWARKAKWSETRHEETKNTTWSAVLPLELVGVRKADDEMGMGMAMMNPMAVRVIKAKLILNLNAEGALTSLVVKVVRNDPMAAIQELVAENGGEINPMDLMDRDPIEGATHEYRFAPAKDASQRAKGLFAAFRQLEK